MSLPLEPWHRIGPHSYFDLVRLARRGRSTLVRVLYILALFAALAAVYWRMTASYDIAGDAHTLTASQNRNALIAERFSYTILIGQNIAVLVLMPIYIAASVHEERDSQALGLLFATHLSARAILQGKLAARIGQVGGVLLAGLPILACIQLWGGIDMPVILANFCNTLMWLFSVGAFSLVIAVRASSTLRAVALTYAILGAIALLFCTPAFFADGHVVVLMPHSDAGPLDDGYKAMWEEFILLTGVHAISAVVFLQRAVVGLEALRREEPTIVVPPAADALPAPRNRFWRFPPIWDNAVAWKEAFLDRGYAALGPYIAIPLLFILGGALMMVSPLVSLFEAACKFIAMGSAGIYLALVAFRAAGCIVRERQQGSLEPLLLLPITRDELLGQKIVGVLMRYWPWLVPGAVAWLMAAIFGRGPVIGAVALLAVMVSHLAFFTLLGLLLSVTCRTALAAYTLLAVISMTILGLPAVAWMLGGIGEPIWSTISPLSCWMAIVRDLWTDGPQDPSAMAMVVVNLVLYAGATFSLWGLARWRFAVE